MPIEGDAGPTTPKTTRTVESSDSPLTVAAEALATSAAASVGTQDAVAPTDASMAGALAKSGSPADVDDGDLVRLTATLAGFLKIGGYSNAVDAIKAMIQNWPRYDAPVDILDVTDIGAATNYFPSSAGVEMLGYDDVSILLELAGGVTVTVEADVDDAAGASWAIDITQACLNLVDNTTGNASFVDVSAYLLAEGLNVTRIRIKYITSDATNAVKIGLRRKTAG